MFSPSTAADFKILSASFLALSIDLLIYDFSKNLEITKPSIRPKPINKNQLFVKNSITI